MLEQLVPRVTAKPQKLEVCSRCATLDSSNGITAIGGHTVGMVELGVCPVQQSCVALSLSEWDFCVLLRKRVWG